MRYDRGIVWRARRLAASTRRHAIRLQVRPYRFRVRVRSTRPHFCAEPVSAVERASRRRSRLRRLDGLEPDKAFVDDSRLDITKPFYPFGQQPQPGATFYFTNEEVFSKPGATVRIYLPTTQSPLSANMDASCADFSGGRIAQPPRGARQVDPGSTGMARQWAPFCDRRARAAKSTSRPRGRRVHGAGGHGADEVNEQEARWMRVRLLSGGFGFTQTVSSGRPQARLSPTRSPTSSRSRRLAALRRSATPGSTARSIPRACHVQRFRLRGSHRERALAGRYVRAVHPRRGRHAGALPGLRPKPAGRSDRPLLRHRRGAGAPTGPALRSGSTGTVCSGRPRRSRTRPAPAAAGIVNVLAPADDNAARVRRAALLVPRPAQGRRSARGADRARHLPERRVGVPAPHASQAPRSARATAHPTVPASRSRRCCPEEIEVREVAGRAHTSSGGSSRSTCSAATTDPGAVRSVAVARRAETEFTVGDVRLRRDRHKRVSEVWVRWYGRPHLSLFRGRPIATTRSTARRAACFFGDGEHGRVPPLGAAVLARVLGRWRIGRQRSRGRDRSTRRRGPGRREGVQPACGRRRR